jgi:hypothetical protein
MPKVLLENLFPATEMIKGPVGMRLDEDIPPGIVEGFQFRDFRQRTRKSIILHPLLYRCHVPSR